MAEKLIQIRVLTNKGLAVTDEAVAIQAPGGLGYLGVLRNHAPLVSTVAPGKLTWRRADGSTRMLKVGSGLLEVAQNCVTLLTDKVSEPSGAAVEAAHAA